MHLLKLIANHFEQNIRSGLQAFCHRRRPPQENAWIFQVVFILFFGSVWAKMVV